MTMSELTTDERISLRRAGLSYCPRCENVVEMLSFDVAAKVYNTDLQDITWLAGNGDLHQLHDRRARLMICGPSLYEVIDKRRTRLLPDTFEFTARQQGAERQELCSTEI